MIRISSNYRANQQGFSLLEILVAFSILSVLLGVLLNIFSTGVRTAQLTGEYARAIQIAESLLTTVTTTKQFLSEEEQFGVIDEIYSWTVTIERFEPMETGWNEELSVSLPFRVEVDVSWTEGTKERTFRLVTLRLSEKNDLP